MKITKIIPIISLSTLLIMSTINIPQIMNGQRNYPLLNIVLDRSHGSRYGFGSTSWFAGNITISGGSFDDTATGPGLDTNVLLLEGPSGTNYNWSAYTKVLDWFDTAGPKLIWLAADSDYGGFYSPGNNSVGSNGLLNALGSQLRLSADSIEDYEANDGAYYRVAPNVTVTDGNINNKLNKAVNSVIMHGPTSVLGYSNNTIVDLRSDSLPNVEVIIKTSSYATSIDNDLTYGYFDYYSNASISNGSYPMMVIEDMGYNKYIIVSGEAIFSNSRNMYGLITEQGHRNNPAAWNNGTHDGKILVDNVFDWFSGIFGPRVSNNLDVVFDISQGVRHTEISWLESSITFNGGKFVNSANGPTFTSNVLLLAGPTDGIIDSTYYNDVNTWFNSGGAKLLWVAGDSDFRGEYSAGNNTSGSNGLLSTLGSQLRLSADSIEDYEANDAAFYRVAPNVTINDGILNSVFNNGVSSVIMHGPTSVLGYYNNNIIDLRSNSLSGVEVVMTTSQFATPANNYVTNNIFEYYSNQNINGSYPMMVIEDMGNDHYIIVSGEVIFSNYKNMYGLTTEQGDFNNPAAWNNGFHDGKILVDNVFSWFFNVVNRSPPPITSIITETSTINDPSTISVITTVIDTSTIINTYFVTNGSVENTSTITETSTVNITFAEDNQQPSSIAAIRLSIWSYSISLILIPIIRKKIQK